MPPELPPHVKTSMDRGRKKMRKGAPKRRLCMRFEKGDTYWYIDSKGALNFQSTVTSAQGSGKPPHRIRNTYNFIRPIVEAKVSAATQRIPSYEITPTTTDANAIAAAKLAQRVALFGYTKWRLRNASLKTVKLAIAGGGDGFALPYFDPNVGPYTQVDGQAVGRGEIKILVLSGNEVYWEAGSTFEESPWYVVERARSIDDVYQTPGLIPGTKLAPDASTNDIPSDRDASDNLVMTSEYFERPTPRFPDGRCITIANGKPIVDYRLIDPTCLEWWGPYPYQDAEGTVIDEPILHRLSYTVDADTDRDFGLVWQLIDFERTAQDCVNKLLEWKNRCLNPQMIAAVNQLVGTPSDVPGDIRFYRPIGGYPPPQWENPPEVPRALFDILNWCVTAMGQVASDQQVDPAPNLAARTLEAGIEQSQNRWQSFLGDLAEWHAGVMRHCLLLVSRYYTEPRLLQIQGRNGQWGLQQDFRGSQLAGQTEVRVLPGSITPITRAGIQDQLTWINQNWPGYLNPEAAIAALEAGTLERITESYWLDVGKVNTVIQKVMDGTVLEMPTRTQDVTGQDGEPVQQQVPTYMPGPADNLNVWKAAFGDFLKEDAYEHLDPGLQTVADQIWSGIQTLEQERAQQQVDQQNEIASAIGSKNAAKPQEKAMPSLPGSSTVPAGR